MEKTQQEKEEERKRKIQQFEGGINQSEFHEDKNNRIVAKDNNNDNSNKSSNQYLTEEEVKEGEKKQDSNLSKKSLEKMNESHPEHVPLLRKPSSRSGSGGSRNNLTTSSFSSFSGVSSSLVSDSELYIYVDRASVNPLNHLVDPPISLQELKDRQTSGATLLNLLQKASDLWNSCFKPDSNDVLSSESLQSLHLDRFSVLRDVLKRTPLVEVNDVVNREMIIQYLGPIPLKFQPKGTPVVDKSTENDVIGWILNALDGKIDGSEEISLGLDLALSFSDSTLPFPERFTKRGMEKIYNLVASDLPSFLRVQALKTLRSLIKGSHLMALFMTTNVEVIPFSFSPESEKIPYIIGSGYQFISKLSGISINTPLYTPHSIRSGSFTPTPHRYYSSNYSPSPLRSEFEISSQSTYNRLNAREIHLCTQLIYRAAVCTNLLRFKLQAAQLINYQQKGNDDKEFLVVLIKAIAATEKWNCVLEYELENPNNRDERDFIRSNVSKLLHSAVFKDHADIPVYIQNFMKYVDLKSILETLFKMTTLQLRTFETSPNFDFGVLPLWERPNANAPSVFDSNLAKESERLLSQLSRCITLLLRTRGGTFFLSGQKQYGKDLLLANTPISPINFLVETLKSNGYGGKQALFPSLSHYFQLPPDKQVVNLHYLSQLLTFHCLSLNFLDDGVGHLIDDSLSSDILSECLESTMKNLCQLAIDEIGMNALCSNLSYPDGISFLLAPLRNHALINPNLDNKAQVGRGHHEASIQYSLTVLHYIVEREHNITRLMANGSIQMIHETISPFAQSSFLSIESKNKISHILEWISPGMMWFEKGIEGLLFYFKSTLSLLFQEDFDENQRRVEREGVVDTSKVLIPSFISACVLLSNAARENGRIASILYSQNILIDAAIVIDKAFHPIPYMTKHQYNLRILLPMLEMIFQIILKLNSSNSFFKNQLLFKNLLKIQTELIALPEFLVHVPLSMESHTEGPLKQSKQTVFIREIYNKILDIFRIWHCPSVLVPQVLDHLLFVPRNLMAGLSVLEEMLPNPLPLFESTATLKIDFIPELLKRRAEWVNNLESCSDRLVLLCQTVLITSSSIVYKHFLRLCHKLFSLLPSFAEKIVFPSLFARLNAESEILKEKPEGTHQLFRMLNLLLSLARSPSGKTILNRYSQTMKVVLPLLNSTNIRVSAIAFAILAALVDSEVTLNALAPFNQRIVDDLPLPEDYIAMMNALDETLIKSSYSAVYTALLIIKETVKNPFGRSLFLERSKLKTLQEVNTTLGEGTEDASCATPMVKFLNRLAVDSFIMDKEIKEVTETTVEFVYTLASQFKAVKEESEIELFQGETETKWTANRMRVYFGYVFRNEEDVNSHPFHKLLITFSKVSEEDFSGSNQVKQKLEAVISFFEELRRDVTEDIETAPPQYNKPSTIAESFFNRQILTKEPTMVFDTRSLDLTGLLLENEDFIDSVTLDEDLVPEVDLEENNVKRSGGQKQDANIQSLKKEEGTQSFTQYTYNSRKDPFRNRKPNTSRPPSTHVDAFNQMEKGTKSGSSPKLASLGSKSTEDVSETNRNRKNSLDHPSDSKKVKRDHPVDTPSRAPIYERDRERRDREMDYGRQIDQQATYERGLPPSRTMYDNSLDPYLHDLRSSSYYGREREAIYNPRSPRPNHSYAASSHHSDYRMWENNNNYSQDNYSTRMMEDNHDPYRDYSGYNTSMRDERDVYQHGSHSHYSDRSPPNHPSSYYARK
eukprot:TRINITY_DN1899_c0_g1_i1.p1 TRINITY_DN1899_c0_g1~~TRINITY_DN1899_c0_g1_i1.p1  ORF type:complete len:1736 (-),score=504.72 TRINITY_DN1899_c0_g1_i1:1299-6506(-)